MKKFNTLKGVAAPMPTVNIDTDQIIPKQFLKTIKRTGLGVSVFFPLRYAEDGSENPDFVLNREPYRQAKMIVAGDNFGCGSSREHAPWALLDFGISAVIAPSFADIFRNNCFKNGMLPIAVPQAEVDKLMADATAGSEIAIDLDKQQIRRPNGEVIPFEIDQFRKHCLLNGLDDIGLTLQKHNRIADFEGQQRQQQPWLYAN